MRCVKNLLSSVETEVPILIPKTHFKMKTHPDHFSQKIARILMAVALLSLFAVGKAQAQSLIVGVQDNGYVRYYNPQNNSSGFVNTAAAYTGGQTVVSAFAVGSNFYSMSKKTSDGSYAISYVNFSSLNTSTSGSQSLSFTQNVITNAVSDTLVDFARVGTDFYFLGSTGNVYLNSSTTALYNLGTSLTGTYSSLTLVGGQLYAGAYTSATNNPDYKVTVGASPVSTQISSVGGTGSGLELAGNSSAIYFVRQDGLAYETTQAVPNYRGNFGGVVEAGVGINSTTGINTLYGLTSNGTVRFAQADATSSVSSFVIPTGGFTMMGMGVVTVVPEPSTAALALAGLLGAFLLVRRSRRLRFSGKV